MNSPSPTTASCPSAYAMDLLVANEHDAATTATLHSHCKTCPACTQRLHALRDAQATFAQTHTLSEAWTAKARAAQTLAKPSAPPWWKTWRGLLFPATGTLALAALALLVWQPPPPTSEHFATTRRKGGFAIEFYLQRDGVVSRGEDGDIVHPNDALRFSFTAASPGFTYLLGIDATGDATVYFATPPAVARASTASAEPLLMPDSIVLDETMGQEEFWGLHCIAEQATPVLAATLGQTHALNAVPGCDSATLTLRKQRRE